MLPLKFLKLKKLFKKILFSAIVLAAIIFALFLFSQTALGKRLYFPVWFIDQLRGFLSENELRACDYKDGTIILVKPVATGVGEGRYEAGDIVEIRDGETLCERFGNGNFLGNEERTMLLPVYYPGKLSDEQKKELVEPEYEGEVKSEKLKVQSDNSKFKIEENQKTRQSEKMTMRRQYGVDYTLVLSEREILKARNFEKLSRLPEVNFSAVIKKDSGLSFNENPLFHPGENNYKDKKNHNYTAGNIDSNVLHKNLFLLLSFSKDSQKDNGNQYQAAGNIGNHYGIINIIHNYFTFDKYKLADQLKNESNSPRTIDAQFAEPLNIGSIKTAAKNTWPISRQISDNVSNFTNENDIYSNYSNERNGVNNSNSVVRVSDFISRVEKGRAILKNLARSVIPLAFAQTESVKTVDTGGYADYLSLNAWEAARQADLTAGGGTIAIAKCRAATATSTADTTAVTIDGWTTSAADYIKIWTDPTEDSRHSGKWDDSKYNLTIASGGFNLRIIEDYVRVDGLQFSVSGTITADNYPFQPYGLSSSNEIRLSNSIFKGHTNASYVYKWLETSNTTYLTLNVWNCIIYQASPNWNSYVNIGTAAHVVTIYSTTIISNASVDYGIRREGGTLTMKNCYVGGSGSSNYMGTITKTTCASADATGSAGLQSIAVSAANFLNVTAGSEDYHIPYGSALINVGTNTSGDAAPMNFTTDIDNQTRHATSTGVAWDIGADEYYATTIYRSTGFNNTSALATGASNSMSISGSTATFTTGLGNTIGVGDVIQYDADNNGTVESLAFIHGRSSATSYTVKDVAGKMASSTTAADTDWSIFRAYISLSNAEAGTENTGIAAALRNFDSWSGGKNLASSTEQWNIAAYADAADTTAVDIIGWTTTADNYIKIYTPVSSSEVGTSQRHAGKWDDTKYRLSVTNLNGIDTNSQSYVRIDGLQIQLTVNGSDSGNYAINAGGEQGTQISNNILKMVTSGTATNEALIRFFISTGFNNTAYIWNNILYDASLGGTNTFYAITLMVDGNAYVYNNTIHNCYQGVLRSYGTVTLKNNLFSGNTVDASGTISDTYNATSNNNTKGLSAGGTGNRFSQSFAFADETNDDFHLSQMDKGALGNGANLSLDANLAFSTDIDGDSRPGGNTGNWDIGADEIVAPGKTTINKPLTNFMKDSSLVGYWSFDGGAMGTTSATDLSGNSNTGWLYNGTKKVVGNNGQALSFDGVDDYVDIPVADTNFLGALTISAWVKFNAGSTYHEIAQKTASNGANNNPFEFRTTNDATPVLTLVRAKAFDYRVFSGQTVSINQWHHVVVVLTNGLIETIPTFYLDNSSVTGTVVYGTATGAVTGSNADIWIGRRQDGAVQMNGLIDEVRIYNRSLSQSEISDLYRVGAAKLKVNTTPTKTGTSLDSGLMGNWTFNGADMNWASSTAEALDRSGNNNNGNVVNFGQSAAVIGKVGQALSFDGVDDRVQTPTTSFITALNSPHSAFAWVYPLTAATAGIWSYGEVNDMDLTTCLGLSSSLHVIWSRNGCGSLDTDSGLTISANQWSFIGFVRTATNVTFFANGLTATVDVSDSSTIGTDPYLIGVSSANQAFKSYFNGLIDEVRVYNRALSATEIQELYNMGIRKAKFRKY